MNKQLSPVAQLDAIRAIAFEAFHNPGEALEKNWLSDLYAALEDLGETVDAHPKMSAVDRDEYKHQASKLVMGAYWKCDAHASDSGLPRPREPKVKI